MGKSQNKMCTAGRRNLFGICLFLIIYASSHDEGKVLSHIEILRSVLAIHTLKKNSMYTGFVFINVSFELVLNEYLVPFGVNQ